MKKEAYVEDVGQLRRLRLISRKDWTVVFEVGKHVQ